MIKSHWIRSAVYEKVHAAAGRLNIPQVMMGVSGEVLFWIKGTSVGTAIHSLELVVADGPLCCPAFHCLQLRFIVDAVDR